MAIQIGPNRVVAALDRDREKIGKEWVRRAASAIGSKTSSAETEKELRPLFDALIVALVSGNLDASDPAFDEVRAILVEYSRVRARQGYSPAETAAAIFILRDAVLANIHADGAEIFADFPAFSKLIDELGLITFTAYVQTREAVIINQTEQLLELSTPVVKVWDGIVAVPLVGTLDSERTQIVMESLLDTLVSTGSEHAIIDITGVPAVDTQVAQHLLKTVFAARLMGAECVISGIRPQIAQTVVGLGIEFGTIATKATLADALRLAFERSGLEVRASRRRE